MYLYWDKSSAFQLDSDGELQLNMSISIHRIGNWHYPLYGLDSTELLFILGNVGRYCWRILDSQQRNFAQEAILKGQLCY
jgi:hypothetical protein